jgi:hypothetical protein
LNSPPQNTQPRIYKPIPSNRGPNAQTQAVVPAPQGN